MDNHVHRATQMGSWVLINAGWYKPDQTLVAEKAALSEPGRAVDYYRLQNKQLVDHAKKLLALEADPILHRPNRERPGENETVTVHLDLEILNEHHPVVEQIASGNRSIISESWY